jgi:hypothetical protein
MHVKRPAARIRTLKTGAMEIISPPLLRGSRYTLALLPACFLWTVACFGGSRAATGNPEPALSKHVELSATSVSLVTKVGLVTHLREAPVQ